METTIILLDGGKLVVPAGVELESASAWDEHVLTATVDGKRYIIPWHAIAIIYETASP